MRNKKVVIFGGGTGITQILSGLKLFPVSITAVISVADNGSSTGKLRDEFSMPAMGDIRKVITSLSDASFDIKNLLEYRFNTYSDLNGHPVGNLILVGMYNLTGSLSKSIDALSDLLGIKNKVLPLTEDSVTLMGEDVDGNIISGEENITLAKKKYKKFFYKDEVDVHPDVLSAILDADMIIFSMGSVYTSIIPHLIASSVINAIDHSKAKILYVCNAVTQPGETDGFKVSDHVKVLNNYLGKRKIDIVLASNTKIDSNIVKKYETKEQKDLVMLDNDVLDTMNIEVIADDLIAIQDNKIRHDSMKVAMDIFNVLMK